MELIRLIIQTEFYFCLINNQKLINCQSPAMKQPKITLKQARNIKNAINPPNQVKQSTFLLNKDPFSIIYDKIQYQLDDPQPNQINKANLSLIKYDSNQYHNKNCDKSSFCISKYFDEQVQIPQQLNPVSENIEGDSKTPENMLKNLATQGKATQISSSLQYEVHGKQDENSQEYLPDDHDSKKYQYRRACQTKNITKNFGKAIITFILKHKQFTRKFAKENNIDQRAFLKKVRSFQDKVSTIRGLRYFWLEQTNPFAREVRIISWIYLRKYSLEHIFNSRVKNIQVNVKYRLKMLQSLKRPRQFTYIKDT